MTVRPQEDAAELRLRAIRIGGLLGATWLLYAGYFAWLFGGGYSNAGGALVSFVCYALFFVAAYVTLRPSLPDWYPAFFAGALVLGIVAYCAVLIYYRTPGIQTDGLAIDLAAAQSVLHGENPYLQDYTWAFKAYHLSSSFNTPRTDGTIVSTMTYPALSFLLLVPTELVRIDGRWLSVLAYVVALCLTVRLAPKELKTVAPLVFLIDPFHIEYVVGSVQDIVFVPLLMLAAYFWEDMPVLAGACLGLAGAVKQEPWLAAPFFLIGVFAGTDGSRGQRLRRAAAAALAALACFALPNAYYVFASPGAWLSAVLEPFKGKNVEAGTGLVNLALAGYFQLPRAALVLFSFTALAASLVVSYRLFGRVRNAVWLAPGFILFFAPRSLENYFLYLIPVCLASWFGRLPAGMEHKGELAVRLGRLKALRIIAAVLVVAIYSMTIGCARDVPVQTSVRRVADSKTIGSANLLQLDVRNAMRRSLPATYLVAWSSFEQFLWRCVSGCGPIPNGVARAVTIQAPDSAAAIPNGATAVVRIVDAGSGDEFTSQRFHIDLGLVHMVNPCLCGSKDVGYLVPAGWTITRADFASGDVTYEPREATGRLGLTVRATNVPGWSYKSIYQHFVPFDHPIRAGVSKTVLYEGGSNPTRYAGISIADDKGHFEFFAWGAVPATQVYLRKGVFIVEPAATAGSDLSIDFVRYKDLAGFSADAQYSLRLVIAALNPKQDLTATFTGFRVSDAENRIRAPAGRAVPLDS